jgi:hypothetical protein
MRYTAPVLPNGSTPAQNKGLVFRKIIDLIGWLVLSNESFKTLVLNVHI